MPNDGRNIYVDAGKGIDLIKDVYAILGITARSNGYDLGYAYFNEHGKINQDSLIKPIYTDSAPFIPVSEFGKYNFGYVIPVYALPSASDLINAAKNYVWEFQPPVKGRNYANLTHFNGYDHEAAFDGWGKPYIEIFNEQSVAYVHCRIGSAFSTAVCPERIPRFNGWRNAFLLCRVAGDNVWQPYYAGCFTPLSSVSGQIPIQSGASYIAIQFMCETAFGMQNVEGLVRMPWADGAVMIPNYKEKAFCISDIVTADVIDRTPRYTAVVTATADTALHKLDYAVSIQNINTYATPIETGIIRLKWYLATDPYSVVPGATYRRRYVTETIFGSVLVQGEDPINAGTGILTFTPASNEVYVECEYSDSAIKDIDKPQQLRWRIA